MKKAKDFLFPTPVMLVDFEQEEFNGQACIDLLLKNFDHSRFQKESTITTDDGLFRLPPFKSLIDLIDIEAREYVEEMHLVDFDTLKMTAMWANVHRGRSSHLLHMHPNAFISGVFYLYIPENYIPLYDLLKGDEGNISFEDPREARHATMPDYRDKYAWECARAWDYKPKTNKLILFPGYLKHQVYDFDSGEEYRISVSFNYMIVKAHGATTSFDLK